MITDISCRNGYHVNCVKSEQTFPGKFRLVGLMLLKLYCNQIFVGPNLLGHAHLIHLQSALDRNQLSSGCCRGNPRPQSPSLLCNFMSKYYRVRWERKLRRTPSLLSDPSAQGVATIATAGHPGPLSARASVFLV